MEAHLKAACKEHRGKRGTPRARIAARSARRDALAIAPPWLREATELAIQATSNAWSSRPPHQATSQECAEENMFYRCEVSTMNWRRQPPFVGNPDAPAHDVRDGNSDVDPLVALQLQ
jgi:hypothetical protein